MQEPGATPLRLARRSFDASGPDDRLAELVAHLTGCDAPLALRAVERALPGGRTPHELTADDRLGVLAEALLTVRRAQPAELRTRRPA